MGFLSLEMEKCNFAQLLAYFFPDRCIVSELLCARRVRLMSAGESLSDDAWKLLGEVRFALKLDVYVRLFL
ncbi:unnamed protein product [Enterobius vermicularis]|uniref:Uncharacterized protein n=1 Tax=Enterobius vermicularis TaxID=51028 RepID=A0A0N4VIH3_ENTVE|nr:unnamed protein product [Enterobius vermicularis]